MINIRIKANHIQYIIAPEKSKNRKNPRFQNFSKFFKNTIYNINLHIAFLISNMTIGLEPYRNHMRDHLLAIEIGRKKYDPLSIFNQKVDRNSTFFYDFNMSTLEKRCRILTAKMRGVFLVFVVF